MAVSDAMDRTMSEFEKLGAFYLGKSFDLAIVRRAAAVFR